MLNEIVLYISKNSHTIETVGYTLVTLSLFRFFIEIYRSILHQVRIRKILKKERE
jgi:hypothetical protein